MKDFKGMDTNGDGRVSMTEASSNNQLHSGFRTADANGDGYLSETEFKSWSASSSPSSSFVVAVELELIVVTLEHNRFVESELSRA